MVVTDVWLHHVPESLRRPDAYDIAENKQI